MAKFKTYKRMSSAESPSCLPPCPLGSLLEGNHRILPETEHPSSQCGTLISVNTQKINVRTLKLFGEELLTEPAMEQDSQAGGAGVPSGGGTLVFDKNPCFIAWNKIIASSCYQAPSTARLVFGAPSAAGPQWQLACWGLCPAPQRDPVAFDTPGPWQPHQSRWLLKERLLT